MLFSPRHSDSEHWKKFLAAGEILIACSRVMKKSPFGIQQARQLLLTDAPALIYADPRTKEYKGEVPWDERDPPTVKLVSLALSCYKRMSAKLRLVD
jgi:hypothetical protein